MKPHNQHTGSEAIDAVLHAAHRIRNATDAQLRAHGLSLSSYKLLRALDRESCSMRELSDVLHVAPRTVTDLVDGLEKRSLVTRGAHPNDRRVTLLRITDTGTAELTEARHVAERVQRAATGNLTAQQQATLVTLLEQVDPDRPTETAKPPEP